MCGIIRRLLAILAVFAKVMAILILQNVSDMSITNFDNYGIFTRNFGNFLATLMRCLIVVAILPVVTLF